MKHVMRLTGFLIDVTASFFIYLIIAFSVSYFEFLPYFRSFFFTWLTYYIVCYLVWKRTFGQIIISYGVADHGGNKSYPVRIVLREVLTSVPAIILMAFGWEHLSIIRAVLLLVLCCILAIFRKKIFKISIVKKPTPSPACKRAVTTYLSLLIIALISRVLNSAFTYNHSTEDSILYAVPQPTANSVRTYTDFLTNNRLDINDYVMSLFDRYDHVILCERAHREMTQYDMIYNLVTDSRFVDKVGRVFTEVGNAESRDAYKALCAQEFADESTLDSCLSSFLVKNQSVHLLWPNTNWFEFLKKIYYYNNSHDKKVDILFADRDWIDKSEIDFRDSIMADNIINTVKSDSTEKSLIIMNYRHAYLKPGNCGYFIDRRFPGKVANVLINTGKASLPAILMGKELLTPIQNGKWDVAFEQIADSAFAFDLKSSPFGNDSFDHFVLPWSQVSSLKYEDMFNGCIFYNSLDKHNMSIGYPHILDSDNISKLHAREEAMKDYSLDYWIESLKDGEQYQKGIDFYYESNLIENKIIICVFILGGILFLVSWLIYRRNTKSA